MGVRLGTLRKRSSDSSCLESFFNSTVTPQTCLPAHTAPDSMSASDDDGTLRDTDTDISVLAETPYAPAAGDSSVRPPELTVCPVCGVSISVTSNSQLNEHIDLCLNRQTLKQERNAHPLIKPPRPGSTRLRTSKGAAERGKARNATTAKRPTSTLWSFLERK